MPSQNCLVVSAVGATVFCIIVGLIVLVSNKSSNEDNNSEEDMNLAVSLTIAADKTTQISVRSADKMLKTNRHDSFLNGALFFRTTKLLGVLHVNDLMLGMTALGNEIFIVCYGSAQINVYDITNLTLSRNLTVEGSTSLTAIVASQRVNCLYVCDYGQYAIHRYNLSDNVISRWNVDGKCFGISLTVANNVLVTLYDTRQLKEYTPDGSLVREINLDSAIVNPYHSVQLSSGQFVVSHEGSSHRVCIVDDSGLVVRTYVGVIGSDVGQLNLPRYLAVDDYDNVLVADLNKNRVSLLSPSLTHLGYVATPGYELNEPWGVHLDLKNRNLCIAEWSDVGRVLVLALI